MHQKISQPLQPGHSGPRKIPAKNCLVTRLSSFKNNLLRIIASQATNSGIEHLSAGGGDGEGAWEVLDVVLVVAEVLVVAVVVLVLVVAVVVETGGSGVVTGAKFAQNIMIQRDKMYAFYNNIMFM